ncbi:MAG: ATP-binding protein [Nitrospirae bacterium]|nr:ATP-binding protein [Nitrospirota bacterium]
MEDISLHILDIAENSYNAGASRIGITLRREGEVLEVEIVDNGRGMDEEALKRCRDPFYTTQRKGFGLGIAFFMQSASESEGEFDISSVVGEGTRIWARFRLDHMDCKPLGDIAETITTLLYSRQGVDISLKMINGDYRYEFDSDLMKKEIEPVPINNISVIKLIKADIIEGQRGFIKGVKDII